MRHGLRYPADLVAWRRWHESRHPLRGALRAARARVRPPAPSSADLVTPGPDADVLVAVEATHASVSRAVVAPLAHLDPARTAILAPPGWHPPEAYAAHTRTTVSLADPEPDLRPLGRLGRPGAVLAAGHYTEIGAAAFAYAETTGATFYVSQHGALTPYGPPLPRAAHLLAWSESDSAFWTAGRSDVATSVVGSQMLWSAGRVSSASAPSSPSGPLTYLGQGHAAEISRARLAHAALVTCREHGAVYRPHPSERDVTSRAMLRVFTAAGVEVVTDPVPLAELDAPILSVFSTGVLEAAARGQQAWVDFPRPPAWLGEFWERYGMRRFGDAPTPAPDQPALEPAQRIAELLMEATS